MRICLIGAGNVGTRLGMALHEAGQNIVAVYSRNIGKAKILADLIGAEAHDDLAGLPESTDLVILAVHDDAIAGLYHTCKTAFAETLLVHTAGSIPITVFENHPRCGALWPVQTLSAKYETDMHQVPFVISGNSDETIAQIDAFIRSVSAHIWHMDDASRLKLHLCATFVNNFTNHMYVIAAYLLAQDNIPVEILHPIVRETAAKIERMSPTDAQTGAARRGDMLTMEKHLALLKDDPALSEIYQLLSESIRKYSR